ncbi:MAG: exodeoxyribonuclease VII small subunit [Bacilli bacterium]|nr:exodeoxyribonuclease VII small subunit [Bacilli bacterium]
MAEKKEKELSFEESLASLEEIVKKLETGEVPLDDAIEEFNKAMKLAKACDEKLKKAEESITKLVKDNGDTTLFQVDE